MAKTTLGTDVITGLNVGTAPHKIAPHELQVSENGWTDKEGAWRTARGPERLYTGYSDISCFAAGEMGGEDHLVWMDGDTVYDNGNNVGTITAGSDMKIIAIDDAFLILGAAVNYIWDGDHVRQQGTWQPDDVDRLFLQKSQPSVFGTNIDSVTSADPGVVKCVAHELATGDWIYIDSLTTMTELNGRKFKATYVDADHFSINEDTTYYTAEGAGTLTGTYKRYAGLDGAYKWYYTLTVEMSGGRVLESQPRGLRLGTAGAHGWRPISDPSADAWDAEEITMTANDVVYFGQDTKLYGSIGWVQSGVQNFPITGTIGTDFSPGVRIYRTKQNGTDAYLEREFTYGDEGLLYISGVDASFYFQHENDGDNYGCFFGADDLDLGAVLIHGANDHVNPPAASFAAPLGQRLFLNDRDNPDRYYNSLLDGIEYYNELGWNRLPATITGMAQLDRYLFITSQDRVWIDAFTDGLPDIREIRTDTGSKTGIMTTTDDGVLMLEADGLWLFDGARVQKISRRGFDTLDTPQCLTATKDTVYMSGLYDSYVTRQRDSGMVWHGGDGQYQLSDATGGTIYAASENEIVEMFAGAYRGGTMITAAFNVGREAQAVRVVLDIEGASLPTVWVNGNRQSDVQGHVADSTAIDESRRQVWVEVPHLSNHILSVQVDVTGNLTVYGINLEVVA